MIPQQKDDFPLPVALLILGVVIAALTFGPPLISGELPWTEVEAFFVRNQHVLIASGVLFVFNVSALIGGLQHWIGFRKQGSRLRSLRGERALFTRKLFIRLFLGIVAAVLTYLALERGHIGEMRWN